MKKDRLFKSRPQANLHVHTPHSFSFFPSIPALLDRAADEGILVLGINDFDTCEGFGEFSEACGEKRIFPSYGIEVMALSAQDQKEGLLANDPKNPGRVYLCGKGIPRPLNCGESARALLERIKKESQERMAEMTGQINGFLSERNIPVSLSYEEIKNTTASGWVRERHIARILGKRILNLESPAEALKKLSIEDGEQALRDFALLQQILRSKLLKAGGRGYVKEKEGAFPGLRESKKLFLSMGAVPVYPVLADGAGKLTDWEKEPGGLAEKLADLGCHAVEFIPHRNSLDMLLKYANALHGRGFIITAGSEHNSPEDLPLKPVARDCPELPEELQEIFWRGSCAVVGHQEQKSCGKEGFTDENGSRTGLAVEKLIEIGETIIRRYHK